MKDGHEMRYEDWFETNYNKITARICTKGVLDLDAYYYLILEESDVLVKFRPLFT
jgi:hypothetical protein